MSTKFFVKHRQKIQCKIVNIFLTIILSYVLGAQMNRLDETVFLSTHNIPTTYMF